MTDRQAAEPGRPEWMLTLAAPAGAVVAVLLAAAGLVFRHVDTVLVAAPIAMATIVAWQRRPRERLPVPATASASGNPLAGMLRYTIAIAARGTGAEQVQLRAQAHGELLGEYLVSARRAEHVNGVLPVLHSGPQDVLSAQFRCIGADATTVTTVSLEFAARVVIAPEFSPVRSLPLPRTLSGVTGSHVSRRPGDGGEFRDIHPFLPGDRLRRIDWKATARRASSTSDLYVRRTTALAEAGVLIVLDSRDDVGARIASWQTSVPMQRGRSSLDIAREAASALATGYLAAGDRVGYQDLATTARVVQLGGGARQRSRLLRSIELSVPSGPPVRRVRAPLIPTGVLVYLLSTYLDEEPGRLAASWRADGHRVIAVDVLPEPTVERLSAAERLAHRIVLMERADRMRELASAGIEFLRWQDSPGHPSLAAQLRTLERPQRLSD